MTTDTELEKRLALQLALNDLELAEKLYQKAEEGVQRAQAHAEAAMHDLHEAQRKLVQLRGQERP